MVFSLLAIGVLLVSLAAQCGAPSPAAGDTTTRPADDMEMVYVPEGEFTMGSPEGEGDDQEHPQHVVYLDAFWIDKTEVTNSQYRKCVEAGDCDEPGYWSSDRFNGPDQPVVSTRWYHAMAYCAWAGARLPTEAEWEKAARGTDGRQYPWGDEEATCQHAVMQDSSGEGCGQDKTWPVGSKPAGASPYGALDMAGNATEWTSSLYEDYPYSPTDGRDDPDAPGLRVLRGGLWHLTQDHARSAHRIRPESPTGPMIFVSGFRCARSSE
jgi:formylglycine-generating enzyme required for sulfatase activity